MKVGQLELVSERVSQTIGVGDESGYSFTVLAYHNEQEGWCAHVGIRSHGFKSAEDAILHLRHAAEHFVRMLSDKPSPTPERDA